MYINNSWEAVTVCIHFSCFHLCYRLCLRAHRLMKTRKQGQRILGHHPRTLILLGTEPYMFLMTPKYRLSSTSHKFPEASGLLMLEAIQESTLHRQMLSLVPSPQVKVIYWAASLADVMAQLSHEAALTSTPVFCMCYPPQEPLTTIFLSVPENQDPLESTTNSNYRPPLLSVSAEIISEIFLLCISIVLGHCLKYKSLPSITFIHSCSCCYWIFPP